MSLPSLDHFHFRDYEHFYEPAEDTYLLIDALQADAGFLRESVRPSLCLEIGWVRACCARWSSEWLAWLEKNNLVNFNILLSPPKSNG